MWLVWNYFKCVKDLNKVLELKYLYALWNYWKIQQVNQDKYSHEKLTTYNIVHSKYVAYCVTFLLVCARPTKFQVKTYSTYTNTIIDDLEKIKNFPIFFLIIFLVFLFSAKLYFIWFNVWRKYIRNIFKLFGESIIFIFKS